MLNLDQITSDCKIQLDNKSAVKAILDIISENCPDVQSISFGRNNISSLSPFKDLATAAPCLSNLSFEGNNISSLKEIAAISNLQNLRQLIFSGNPVSVQDHTSYIAFLQFKFPMLELIDGQVTPKFMKLNIPENTFVGNLPSVRGSFFSDESAEQFAMTFVPKYFEAYDDENRANLLLDAYHDQSCLSITVGKYGASMELYAEGDRNLVKLDEFDPKLSRNIKFGKVDIAHVLKCLPRTMHNLSSFVADVSLVSISGNPVLSLSIHGQFIEQAKDKQDVNTRGFDRNFLLIAAGNAMGCLILNDQLHIYSSDSQKSVVHAADSSGSDDSFPALAVQIAQAANVPASLAYDYLVRHGHNGQLAYDAILRDRGAA